MNIRNLRFSLILLLLLVPGLSFAQDDSIYVVANAMIDTLSGKRMSDPVVELRNDRIVSVSSGSSIPDGAKIIDLGDATILPGLADLHAHLTYYSTDFGYESLSVSETDEAIRGVVNVRKR